MRTKSLVIFSITLVLTVLVVLLVANLSMGNKPIDVPLAHLYPVADPQFKRAVGSVLTPGLTDGNRAQELLNGDQIFPAMLSGIRNAQRSITLETYIYFSGATGDEFSKALRERAASGVKVHVLLDWIGGELEDALIERMRASGVEIHRYNAPTWHSLARFNNRTHRKLMVIDGRIGFIGGVGLADKWSGHAQGPDHWRDTHFQVEGPVVGQLQSAFLNNWLAAAGDVLRGEAYFPPLEPAGDQLAQAFSASPGGSSKTMQLLYLMSITAAQQSIDLSAAYFIPDEVAKQSLVAAARRGVRVRIIVPGPHMDMAVVRHASRNNWGPLLEAGIEIYEYEPTMFHCKVIVVDGLWTSVGSTNFDSRSFSVNDETNMNVYDAPFAQRQVGVFEQDLQQASRVSLEQWQGRPVWQKMLDSGASLFSSQL